jgi:hypothetical protein
MLGGECIPDAGFVKIGHMVHFFLGDSMLASNRSGTLGPLISIYYPSILTQFPTQSPFLVPSPIVGAGALVQKRSCVILKLQLNSYT